MLCYRQRDKEEEEEEEEEGEAMDNEAKKKKKDDDDNKNMTCNGTNNKRTECALCCKRDRWPKYQKKVVKDTLQALQKDEWVGPVFLKNDLRASWVHQSCALWAPEVFFDHDLERLRKLPEAIERAKKIACFKCKQRGAVIGCSVDECARSYHLICAHDDKCAFNTQKYALACPLHIKRLTMKNQIEWTNFALEELLFDDDDLGDDDDLVDDGDDIDDDIDQDGNNNLNSVKDSTNNANNTRKRQRIGGR